MFLVEHICIVAVAPTRFLLKLFFSWVQKWCCSNLFVIAAVVIAVIFVVLNTSFDITFVVYISSHYIRRGLSSETCASDSILLFVPFIAEVP